MKTILKHYPLSLLTCLAVWVLSLAPIGEMKIVQMADLSDKWAHFIMYGGFVIVIWGEWLRNRLKPSGRKGGYSLDWLLLWTFVVPVAMSGLLELMQAYCTTYRSGDWLDFVANIIGATLGNVVGLLSLLLLRQRLQ